MKLTQKDRLKRRHFRVRSRVAGTAQRPRLFVRKSLRHVYAQLIDDSPETGSVTLASFGTATKDAAGKHLANKAGATALGKSVGEQLMARGITEIVFDRGGYRYHGVVQAFADAVRESGVKF